MQNVIPAKFATIQYFSDYTTTCFRGRPRTTLPITLNKDIEIAHKQENQVLSLLPCQVKKKEHIEELEKLANNRKIWQSIVANMYVFEPPKPKPRPHRHAKQ